MAIIINQDSRLIIQGITGRIGRTFAERMVRYYSNLVGGVTPGKGGQEVEGKPVFDFVHEAVQAVQANASIVVVAAPFVKGAVMEAIDAGIKTIWVYTDKVPVHEALEMVQYARLNGVRLVGPNSAGLVSPGKASAAELSEDQLPLVPGNIGLVSKSGSLSYEVVNMVYEAGFGFSTVICVGGDPVLGTSCRDAIELFGEDGETDAVVLLGEIGGSDEVDCIPAIQKLGRPVVAYVNGHTAPPKTKMGHAGAIVGGSEESAAAKSKLLREAGVYVADYIEQIPSILRTLKT